MTIDLNKFFEFLSIPSISSESAYHEEVRKACLWVKNYLVSIGFETELWETSRHPILFAKKIINKNYPTLLIYNHYDVQPVDPLELWDSPPFEPTVKEGNVFARGAQDNKGQCFYVLEALKALFESGEKLKLNIKCIIEGEEECGSESLHSILPEKKDALQADYLAIVDLGIPALDKPAITLGTRGLITADLEVIGSTTDMHSGMVGGVAYNPIHALLKLLADARAKDGSIAIPGFYDEVLPISSEEKTLIDFSFDTEQFKKDFGALPTGGESGLQPRERLWIRPTLEVNGIVGGYTGTGFKTVIPAKASAKLSCRLVPGQKPAAIASLLKEFFTKNAPPGISVSFHVHKGVGEAARSSPTSKGVQAFAQGIEQVYGKRCAYVLEGASIPIIPALAAASGAEPILLGLGLPSDRIHAPNEHFSIDRLEKGKAIMIEGIKNLAKLTLSNKC